jgi:phosphoglycolate phosphatase
VVIGFDLDMTLVDTRPGIHASLVALSAETGTFVDADAVVGRLGAPIRGELTAFFPGQDVEQVLLRFRRHMARTGVRLVTALPGAADALEAVTGIGGRRLVLTAKHQPLAEATLRHAGLPADVIVGDRWADEKARELAHANARVYVGDHPTDIAAAKASGAVAIGVTTGSASAVELTEVGADLVMASLREFPPWLEQWAGEAEDLA